MTLSHPLRVAAEAVIQVLEKKMMFAHNMVLLLVTMTVVKMIIASVITITKYSMKNSDTISSTCFTRRKI